MRRTTLSIAAIALMILLAGSVALAKSISCPTKPGTNLCVGTNNADTITGTRKADTIRARGGNDNVTARAGKDKVNGGSGADIVDGGSGNDTLSAGPNTIGELDGVLGGSGNDTLVESTGQDRYLFGESWGQDQITGDGDPLPAHDDDDVCFVCSGGPSPTVPLSINLATGTATDGTNSVTWSGTIIESAVGGYGGDTITGNSLSNHINGFLGGDTINVSGDPAGASDLVDCGTDTVTDTVTKDPNDQTLHCDATDHVITVT